jgi:hypothetical protein
MLEKSRITLRVDFWVVYWIVFSIELTAVAFD